MFILYIVTLYAKLETVPELLIIGFANDTNPITMGANTAETSRTLYETWKICKKWASIKGIKFNPNKSELMHFTRAYTPAKNRLHFGNVTVTLTKSFRFFGVYLDRKLR